MVPGLQFYVTCKEMVLVMLPGLDGTGRVFEPLLACLSAEITTRVIHYPADRPLSFQEHVDLAHSRLPKDRPFVLLAESFSGPVGLQLIADPPDNLRGVIFVATFARYPVPFLLDLCRHLPQALLLKLLSLPLFCRLICLGGASDDAVKLFRQALQSVMLTVLSSRLGVLAELPPPPETTFTGPCLYLQASKDRLVPARAARPLIELLPQLQVVQIPGPHILVLAKPEDIARRINSFIFSQGMISNEVNA